MEKHEKQISNLINLKNDGVLEIEDLEKRSPQVIFQMYEIISKVVTENGIIKQENQQMYEPQEVDQMIAHLKEQIKWLHNMQESMRI